MSAENKQEPLVFILILNWKSAEDTGRCIESLNHLNYSNYKIVMIDNHSPDDSEKRLRTLFPKHYFIQTGKNLGYAGGNNAGIRYAAKAGADLVWILNPDIRTEPDSLKQLVDSISEREKIGLCGPVIVERKQGTEPYPVYGWRLLPETGWGGTLNREKNQSPDYLYGCSMLIKMKVFKEIGLLREDFFMYSEEKEFCLRARKSGWDFIISKKAFNDHYRVSNPGAHYYGCRNEIMISRLEKKRRFRAVMYHLGITRVFMHFLKGEIKETLYAVRRIPLKNLKAVIAGLFKPLSNPPSIAYAS